MSLRYERVEDLLRNIGISLDDIPEFTVCSEGGAESFKLMRAQLRGELSYSSERGAYIDNPQHLGKCMQIIKEARKEFVDLLLFPEYAIPYDAINRICKNSQLWPEKNKLWVLPCCGVSRDVFQKKMNQFARLPDVRIIGYRLEDQGYNDIEYKYFINAVLYLFVANVNSCCQLFILPQLKTYSMRDVDFACEEVGLSLGSKIFVFGKNNGTILLSLICADVMNDKIDWREIQSKGANCIILNPQLNANPRNSAFSRLRQMVFDRGIESLMITCNWAVPTVIRGVKESDKDILIKVAWSCIYCKKGRNLEPHKWVEDNRGLIWQTEKKNLYAGIIKNFRTEVWYVDNSEIVHILHITKIRTIGYSIKKPQKSGGYVLKYIFCNSKLQKVEEEDAYDFIEEVKCSAFDFYDKFQNLAKEQFGQYAFPVKEKKRERIDRFFDLISGKINWEYLEISDSEEVHRYTLALTEGEKEIREQAFSSYVYMVQALKAKRLPEHLKKRFEDAHMMYWNEAKEYYNLYEREEDHIKENGEGILVSYVKYEGEAQKLLSQIEHKKKKSGQEELEICIMTQSKTQLDEMVIYPKVNKDITRGKRAFISTDITGGDIDE